MTQRKYMRRGKAHHEAAEVIHRAVRKRRDDQPD